MTIRRVRDINSSITRKMLSLQHSKFQSKLISKAEELGKYVVIQDEAYTTKTCSNCGYLQSVNKIYSCQNCHVLDRDFNGARGIFLRALLDGAVIPQ